MSTNSVGQLVDYVNNFKTMVVVMTREQTLTDPIFKHFPLPILPAHCPGNHTYTILIPTTYQSLEITGTLKEVYESYQKTKRRGFSLGFIGYNSRKAIRNANINSNVLVEVSSVGIFMYLLKCCRCGKTTKPFSQSDILRLTNIERLDHYPDAISIDDIPTNTFSDISDLASLGNLRKQPVNLWDLNNWVDSLDLEQPDIFLNLINKLRYTLQTLSRVSQERLDQILQTINSNDLIKIKTGLAIIRLID